MSDQYAGLTDAERKALVQISIMAAFADGSLNEVERAEIGRITQKFSGADAPLSLQEALPSSLAAVANDLQSATAKTSAYEMAVCICNVDQSLSDPEKNFLAQLRDALKLDPATSSSFQSSAAQLRDQPPVIAKFAPAAAATNTLDEMIKDRAILAGALELMPHRLATMAIIPVQMRMVYSIGKSFGFDLDLAHTKEFFATVGVGLTSQVVEGYLSKVVGHLARPFVGKFVAALASQATESAIAFATTYALGQVAKAYYASGRTLSTGQLRDLFSSMLNDGRSMQSRYAGQIAQKAGSLNVADLVALR
jgi:uncharacterized protein (DUF697 family)